MIVEFQFLIGTVKTFPSSCIRKLFRRFQFLIGTVKTFIFLAVFRPLEQVSIPHRYCKNDSRKIFAHEYIDEFQFLIGTVKTIRIKYYNRSRYKFQFLIGTVKTMLENHLAIHCILVSIPHRYCKNTKGISPATS